MKRISTIRASRFAFTLIELLVVISIIALLVAILLPALGSARKTAQDVQCKSNIKQIGTAMNLYVNDDLGRFLPPAWTFNNPYPDDYLNERKWNGFYLNTYLGHEGEIKRMQGAGASYMRCPSQEQDAWRTYAVNYTGGAGAGRFGFMVGAGGNIVGPRLEDVPQSVFLVADAHNRDWPGTSTGKAPNDETGFPSDGNRAPLIYTPALDGSWPMRVDWDKDGLDDSFNNPLGDCTGPYNGLGPWHIGRIGNFVFSDGHAEGLTLEQWISNRNDTNLWGR